MDDSADDADDRCDLHHRRNRDRSENGFDAAADRNSALFPDQPSGG